jgi:hypothetical protein
MTIEESIKHLIQGESSRLYEAAKDALQEAFRRTADEDAIGKWQAPYDAYCASVQANLLEGVPFDDFRKAFDDGKGKELHGDDRCPPKMAAIRRVPCWRARFSHQMSGAAR